MKKRILSAVISIIMLISTVSIIAFAEETNIFESESENSTDIFETENEETSISESESENSTNIFETEDEETSISESESENSTDISETEDKETSISESESENSTDISETEETDNDIESPIISVAVPTTGEIYFDPFNINQKGQIYSSDMLIINNSSVPIKVTFVNPTASGKEGCDVIILEKEQAIENVPEQKWVSVMLNIIDSNGIEKSIDLAQNENADIELETPIPPGCTVLFNYSGVCGCENYNWDSNDGIKVTTNFKFTYDEALDSFQ